MTRGRSPDALDTARNAAKLAGTRTYAGPPCWTCGTTEHYSSSGACVACSKWRSGQRYADRRQEMAAADAARYQMRKQKT